MIYLKMESNHRTGKPVYKIHLKYQGVEQLGTEF